VTDKHPPPATSGATPKCMISRTKWRMAHKTHKHILIEIILLYGDTASYGSLELSESSATIRHPPPEMAPRNVKVDEKLHPLSADWDHASGTLTLDLTAVQHAAQMPQGLFEPDTSFLSLAEVMAMTEEVFGKKV
jgi:hypothetical protein